MAEDRPDPVDIRVEGPEGDEDAYHYQACSTERCIGFSVVPEEQNGERGWTVQIEGLPDPPIAHDRPWESIEEARDAAVSAVQAMLTLEHMQRVDAGGS